MNILHFFYFLIKADYDFICKQANKLNKKNKINIYLDMVYSSLRYGSSFEDYFIYSFFNKKHKERDSYVVTGLAHRFFKVMNDSKDVHIFRDKSIFEHVFKDFLKRDTIIVKNITKEHFSEWCSKKENVIAKPLDGVQGKGISIYSVKNKNEIDFLYNEFKDREYLIEELISQHSKLQELNPSSVNSIRVITINTDGEPKIIAAVLRIGCGGVVDNFSDGGIAAPINLEDGVVFKEAITRDNDNSYSKHPLTNVDIVGFEIPNWGILKNKVISAAKVVPSIRTVGWDIAITENDIEIIEGNDNWNKNIYQITYGYGKKKEINMILESLK